MAALDSIDSSERVVARPFKGDEDFWRVRDLLIATYPITPTDFNWEIRHWDGQRFHSEEAALGPHWGNRVRLWETEEGRLVGVAHPESHSGEAFLELHPDYRHIEDEMMAWAEETLAAPTGDGERRQLTIFVFEYDSQRQRMLTRRGYEKTPGWGVTRRLRFGNRALPEPTMAEGYVLRSIRPGDEGEFGRLADILNAGFNRSIHTGREVRSFATQAPRFRYDLHLVAEAVDGSFAAHVGVTYDEANRRGIFEPVCAHPDHRRRGLARALMVEGLRRLKGLGATDAYVATGDMVPANELYDAVGFVEVYKGYYWRRLI